MGCKSSKDANLPVSFQASIVTVGPSASKAGASGGSVGGNKKRMQVSKEEQTKAATKVQAVVRGRQTRNQVRQQGRRLLVCYLCGMEYGPTSLAIHQKSCPDKRRAILRDFPPAFMPSPPMAPLLSIPSPDDDLAVFAKYNEQAAENYKKSMPQCRNCSRRFEPDRFPVHLRACKPKQDNP
eukprot:GILJ01005944.1.p1 GENE.GILJ01005944.1~~GILJ01005944.1.p1  ORF type:complete len:199 (+),score=19.05 GILJ01005944.1:56-598(+)